MRTVILIPLLAIAALLAACQESGGPIEPLADEIGTPASKVIHDSWVETISLDGVFAYVGCANDGAGEDLLWSGDFDAYFSSRTTPSGNVMTTCHVDYYTDNPLVAVGLESGDVWNLFKGEDNCNYLAKESAPRLVNDHFQASEWYVNEDTGQKLHARFRFSVQRDLDGNVKTFSYIEDYKCTGKP